MVEGNLGGGWKNLLFVLDWKRKRVKRFIFFLDFFCFFLKIRKAKFLFSLRVSDELSLHFSFYRATVYKSQSKLIYFSFEFLKEVSFEYRNVPVGLYNQQFTFF